MERACVGCDGLGQVVPLALLTDTTALIITTPTPIASLGTAAASSTPTSSADVRHLRHLVGDHGRVRLRLRRRLSNLSRRLSNVHNVIRHGDCRLSRVLRHRHRLCVRVSALEATGPIPIIPTTRNADSSNSCTTSAGRGRTCRGTMSLVLGGGSCTKTAGTFRSFITTCPSSMCDSGTRC